MRLELAVTFLVVFVSHTCAQLDTNAMLTLMGMDPIELPPSLPKSLYSAPSNNQRRQYQMYQQQQRNRVLLEQQQFDQQRRLQQEQLALKKLQNLTQEDMRKLAATLPRERLQQIINRIRQLKIGTAPAPSRYDSQVQNMINSGANTIRRPLASPNAINAKGQMSNSMMQLQRSLVRGMTNRARSPGQQLVQTVQKYRSNTKKIQDAMVAGCTYPTPMGMEGMEMAAFAFTSCSNPMTSSSCLANGRSCANIGGSSMCCPIGVNTQTLDAMNYMNKMQQFIAQFS